MTAFLSLERDAIAAKGANGKCDAPLRRLGSTPINLGTKVSSVGASLICVVQDLDGYEVETAFEFPKPVCSKPTK